jgi:1-pyrroline-5-carboxylate dehydrogenase
MSKGFYAVPLPENEPVFNYEQGSKERAELKKAIDAASNQQIEIPMIIGGKEVESGNIQKIIEPHNIKHVLGRYHQGDGSHVNMAIKAALSAREIWSNLPWEERAAIFLKAAELLAGPYRAKINAATMLGQSKSVFQAEIDSACELIDFLRFNVKYMTDIYSHQPESSPGIWNRIEWRPLEGFVFALTPFNFTSIAGNLPTSPAIMGNVVVWKPSKTQIYSARVIMEVLMEAGLPEGVINMVLVTGPVASDTVFSNSDFAGFHFTGSTKVFQGIWKIIGNNIHKYKTYPRIVGETGGKDFIFVHESADPKQTVTALSRGAFEYQGQKCSAASRAYIPDSIWPEIKKLIIDDVSSFKMGGPEDFTNFINAVIDEPSFDKLAGTIEKIRKDKDAEIIIGGDYDKSEGYFIKPAVVIAKDPQYFAMQEEFFGPVLTIYIYPSDKYEETLELCNKTSIYGLTGSIFANDRLAIDLATRKLRDAAGNFYINDKPTGAVVGQQPFGGSRGSGTNDKAGSILNLFRWVSPRAIKETFIPPSDYRYPYMKGK